ncbi:thioredoxin-like protein [Aurantiacibacter atlanticus]|uniref:Thioredoxin-like protein n=1 Tax=Aurantiacibacter atlanticus TaxID=1648404 RepID=A0A0H4VFU9_9SPHN|nr:TlpA disulfide reductase family protein [Aurantiacibacter atlanticus]AKQ43235.2 thioredoxin-like protein [Aurantiacibacter atlanticus]MDF1833793.1 TlpA disulfide reductase family protein [Alteraurantiacibacter sp. bin_em_oilr2.035]
MAKIRLSSLAAACIAASLLAGCDNGAEDAAQEKADSEATSETSALTGMLDRSFAGEPIPQVTLIDPEGNSLDLAALEEPVLLNLWATWCAPCVIEMPLLDDLAADLGNEVQVLTVSEDLRGADVVVPFFDARDLPNLPRWMDQQNDLAFSYGGGAVLPLTILYDAEGNEVWRVIGAYDWSSASAREEVLEAISASAE